MSISLLFLVVSLVLAILASVGVPSGRLSLFPLAFAFFVAAELFVGGVIYLHH